MARPLIIRARGATFGAGPRKRANDSRDGSHRMAGPQITRARGATFGLDLFPGVTHGMSLPLVLNESRMAKSLKPTPLTELLAYSHSLKIKVI